MVVRGAFATFPSAMTFTGIYGDDDRSAFIVSGKVIACPLALKTDFGVGALSPTHSGSNSR